MLRALLIILGPRKVQQAMWLTIQGLLGLSGPQSKGRNHPPLTPAARSQGVRSPHGLLGLTQYTCIRQMRMYTSNTELCAGGRMPVAAGRQILAEMIIVPRPS